MKAKEQSKKKNVTIECRLRYKVFAANEVRVIIIIHYQRASRLW